MCGLGKLERKIVFLQHLPINDPITNSKELCYISYSVPRAFRRDYHFFFCFGKEVIRGGYFAQPHSTMQIQAVWEEA